MIYFISGHRDITKEEFYHNYITKFIKVIKEDKEAYFVIGDYWGVDEMSQNWLCDNGYANRITVYHMFDSPRYFDNRVIKFSGGYTSDEDRDSAMTKISDFDIAFVRNGKYNSGTEQNIKRRVIIKDNQQISKNKNDFSNGVDYAKKIFKNIFYKACDDIGIGYETQEKLLNSIKGYLR